ncbi:MAG: topoisomerase DNA-binding C4 zinc finger domain-containing protein [Myxococcales bacterium]|nr:topoisomerase DNA-binding C4 zinc finger domain-containing protein [Myxococcales bacterium]
MSHYSEVVIDGHAWSLGNRIGKGGEGVVFAIGDDSRYAVKIYTTSDIGVKEQKVTAMVRARLANQSPLVAFPLSIARSKSGSFIGFAMKLVADHKPLHDLYSPGSRKQYFPQADYRFLVRTAANFARAVASVHHAKCVIGDINHSGILVSPKATVALIDSDSFQFTESGRNYLCRVGVPEYTPPELQGQSLANITRTANHDAFGMAVVIFQLLFMGRHPFVGTVRSGDIPPLHENIQYYRYAYTDLRDVGMDQPPGTPSLTDFSPDIANLFDAAFSQRFSRNRPTALDWVTSLAALEASLEQCGENPLHFAPKGARECAWCEMETRLGTALFLPYITNVDLHRRDFEPGAGGFYIELIWARIEAISRSVPEPTTPILGSVTVSPSPRAVAESKPKSRVGAYAFLAGAIAGFFIFPAALFIWLCVGFTAFNSIQEARKRRIDSGVFERSYLEALDRSDKAVADWKQRIGYSSFKSLSEELSVAHNTLRKLPEEERQLRQEYQNQRRQKQLEEYLNKYDIQHNSVKGIGPAKLATLTSYGITTAADISLSKLLSVPGFGKANSRGLLDWRSKLERNFVYRAQGNDADRREMARIKALIEAKAAPLRKKLNAGPGNLEALAKRIQASVSVVDPAVRQAHNYVEQARCDLNFLGIAVPTRHRTSHGSSTATIQTTRPRPRRTYSTSGGNLSSPNCPRCGSRMTKRLARRGRNAGNHFWGCSRYPSCKGTRNI